MSIKVFRFRVSNWAMRPFSEDIKKECYQEAVEQIKSEKEIEDTINEYINGKEVVSINVNNIDVNYHNNGRGNTVDLVYTILCK